MAVEIEIDVELLKSEIRKTYACVSEEPERDFIPPDGRGQRTSAIPTSSRTCRTRRSSRSPASPTRGGWAASPRAYKPKR
jgi:hypothetical protein